MSGNMEIVIPSLLQILEDLLFDNTEWKLLTSWHQSRLQTNEVAMIQWKFCIKMTESYCRPLNIDHQWLNDYHEKTFFDLFRIKKDTFQKLMRIVLENDIHCLLKKKYRGGHYPVQPEKHLLIFLWYMATQDSLIYIGDRFNVCAAKVMQVINAVLYIIIRLKNKYIFWPSTASEYNAIRNEFRNYPGTLGALDGSHVEIKVSKAQQDSYIDRYMSHSINIMAICTAKRILTYIFVGFPGSAHDSRVFFNSQFVQNIESYGSHHYFPSQEMHIIADSAFPLRQWLMTPYRRNANFGRIEQRHNTVLSADRVAIENCFGIIKGRWRRLQFINTYSVCKCIEIATAACVLHNFTYRHNDLWEGELYQERPNRQNIVDNDEDQRRLGQEKRAHLARQLYNYNH